MASKKSESVKVVVRCRPLSEKEQSAGHISVVKMDVKQGTVAIRNHKAPPSESSRIFTFDSVYDPNSTQLDIYDETVRAIVDAVLQGYNGTIFAYGQTGTGKTYTMEGVRNDDEKRGVIPRSFKQIFNHISQSENEQYLVRASYLEIYQEEIRDLLSKDHQQRLDMKERPDTGVYVKDLSSFVAKSVKEIEHVMSIGNQNRLYRYERAFIKITRYIHCNCGVLLCKSMAGSDGQDHIRVGKLNLVDLAGSERQSKTQSSGEQLKQAIKINLSLSALGNVISALVDGKSTHIPYRDSKLTRLLQDSLGGNAKTVMIANIGPASYNYEESVTTLRYANRAKNIQNKPRINEDPKDALLREYQYEIARLKEALEKRRIKGKKKNKVNDDNGEEVSDNSDEGEQDISSSDKLADVQAKLEEEKQSILQSTEILEEEKQKLLNAVERRVNQLKKEQKKRDLLASKIKAMESKLLCGGNIIDKTTQQQKALEVQRQAIIDSKKKEREIQQKLELQEEEKLGIQENYQTLQDEASLKEKKLKKLQNKLKIVNSEIAEYREEQVRMREELVLQREELDKQCRLRQMIIENFIPQREVERIMKRSIYEDDNWILVPTTHNSYPVASRPVNDGNHVRPMSLLAKQLAIKGEVRYMADNILKLDLDMPIRTTRDYTGPTVSASVQAVLDRAIQSEEEITIDASVYSNKSKQRQSKEKGKRMEGSSETRRSTDPRQNYPIKRGLVKT